MRCVTKSPSPDLSPIRFLPVTSLLSLSGSVSMLIITGQAAAMAYIFICDDKVEILQRRTPAR